MKPVLLHSTVFIDVYRKSRQRVSHPTKTLQVLVLQCHCCSQVVQGAAFKLSNFQQFCLLRWYFWDKVTSAMEVKVLDTNDGQLVSWKNLREVVFSKAEVEGDLRFRVIETLGCREREWRRKMKKGRKMKMMKMKKAKKMKKNIKIKMKIKIRKKMKNWKRR